MLAGVPGGCRRETATTSGPTKFEVQVMAQFDSHNSQVWRVSWNITSTLLASSGDDGCVRLWKGQGSAKTAGKYYHIVFKVVLCFGKSEVKGQGGYKHDLMQPTDQCKLSKLLTRTDNQKCFICFQSI